MLLIDKLLVSGNFKQLTFTSEQLMKIFYCIKDKNKNIVTSESFSNLMSKLERVYSNVDFTNLKKTILNQFVDEEAQGYSPTEEEQNRMKRNMESMIMASEVGSDSEDENNDEY